MLAFLSSYLPRCAPQGMWRVVEALLAAGVRVRDPYGLVEYADDYNLVNNDSPADFPRSHRRVWWVARRRRGGLT